MEPFQAVALLVPLSAALAYINHRLLALPMTIGLMLLSLSVSLVLMVLDHLGFSSVDLAHRLVRGIDFSDVLLHGFLGPLLFAGALHVDLNRLAEKKLEISVLATFGVLASTLLVGTGVFGLSSLLGLELTWIQSLLFGALISPTDPIAVLGILKRAGAPPSLETKIAGESLFNDGIGVVVFLVILEIATGQADVSAGGILALFARETLGGAAFGLMAGYLAFRLLRSINDYQVEVLVTLALVLGGYTLADHWHLSAPMAMVLAGLLIGNHGRRLAMSEVTREHLDTFWELVDTILNALLFVLIGLEVLVLSFKGNLLLAGLLAVPIALSARLISVGAPVLLMKSFREFSPKAIRVLTWGGLRGGISVALALALPMGQNRELILTMTYTVVVFSVVVQGLTIQHLISGPRTRKNTT